MDQTQTTQTNTLKEELSLTKVFNELPPQVQSAIKSFDLRTKIKEISSRYGLEETDSELLEDQVLFSALLINTEEDLLENLSEGLSSREKVEQVFYSVVEEILQPLAKNILAGTKTVAGAALEPQHKIMLETDEVLKNIGKKHDLRIDQMGILEEEIQKRINGEKESMSFHADIKKMLGLDDTKTNNIVKDVNDKIFESIRMEMKKEKAEEETLDRDEILKEIEDAKPKAVAPEPSTPNPKDFLRGNIVQTPEPQKADTSSELFEEKLEKTEPEKKKIIRDTYKGGVDPYREPIS